MQQPGNTASSAEGADAGSVVLPILQRLAGGFEQAARVAPDVERKVRAIREAVERPRATQPPEGEDTPSCPA